MIPQRAGSIINLSGGGATSPRPNFSAYATAKAGLVRFSETLARELAEFHIRVNAVAPGAMNTAMQRAVLDAGAARAGEKEYQLALEQGRDGGAPPERAAELCLFLASPDAAGISGRLISAVWDDWPALGGRPELAASDIYTLRRIVPEDRGMQW
jgi:NAD(P)-dependent dehydrogenase (short-subunit alcohol dehydrogenase family)